MNDNDDKKTQWYLNFTYKTTSDHVKEFLKNQKAIFLSVVTAISLLVTLSGLVGELAGNQTKNLLLSSPIISVVLVISLVISFKKYLATVPNGFEKEPPYISRIAHLQKKNWEFDLAKSLLKLKLSDHDRELSDLNSGYVFVIVKKHDTLDSYIQWCGTIGLNLMQMIDVAELLMLKKFPLAFTTKEGTPVDPKEILRIVEAIERLYAETIEFERSLRSVVTSEKIQEIHEKLFGSSEIIRDALKQLLDSLSKVPISSEGLIEEFKFLLEFKTPDVYSEFVEKLANLMENREELGDCW